MIHQYKNNGYNIVLDVNSGAVHVVDDIVYDLTKIVEKLLEEGTPEDVDVLTSAALKEELLPYEEEEIKEALEEILALKAEGVL